MDIQTKDGILLRGIPDGTPDDVIKYRIEKIRGDAIPKPRLGAPEPMTAMENAALSVDKGLKFAGRLLPENTPSRQNVVDMAAGASGLMRGSANLISPGTGNKIWPKSPSNPGIAKTVGGFFDPVSWAIGGGVGKVLPYAPVAGKGIVEGGKAVLKNSLGGGVAGGTIGALSDEGTAKSGTIAGLALGGLAPLLIEGAKKIGGAAYHFADPWFQSGIDKVKGRTLNMAAGDSKDKVIDALLKNKDIVPGSKSIAGEVAAPAGSAEFSALQKKVAGLRPSEYNAIDESQQLARRSALQSFGKDKTSLVNAIDERSGNAAKDYGAAYANQIKMNPELAQMAKNPYFAEALPDATKLAAANGVNPKENLTQYLHYVKLSLDKQLSKTGDTALSNTEKEAVQGVKQKLLEWMGNKNPSYETARSNFQAASKPINEMQVGQYLENKLISPLGNKERASTFANAVRETPATIKKSTGFPRYENLDQLLKPENVNSVKKITDELMRKSKFEDLAKLGDVAINKQLGIQFKEAPPTGMFSPFLSVARGAVNRLQGKASDKTLMQLSKDMQIPEETVRLMKNAEPAQREAIIDAIMKKMGLPLTVSAPISASQGGN